LLQLRADHRFLGLSLAAPLLIIFLLNVFFDAVATPLINQAQFAVPAAAFIVHFVTYVLTAIVLVRERVAGTMERMFINGYRQSEIVAGYLAAYTCLATLQSILILTELNLLFDLGFGIGDLGEIFLVIWLLALLSMALGMLISNFARNEGQVIPFIPLLTVPSVFLSGLVVAVDRLPQWAQVLSKGVPLTYAVEVIRELVRGGGLGDAPGALGMLPGLTAIVMVLAARTLREEA
jgi:ABC-2 type transport system permease protein